MILIEKQKKWRKKFKPIFLDDGKFFRKILTLFKSQLGELFHVLSLKPKLRLFVVSDFAMKTKKNKKKLYRKTNILPIFNGRYNNKRLNRKESELYLLRVFRVELALHTVFQKHVFLWALIIVIVYNLDEENFENYQKNSKKKELFLCFTKILPKFLLIKKCIFFLIKFPELELCLKF